METSLLMHEGPLAFVVMLPPIVEKEALAESGHRKNASLRSLRFDEDQCLDVHQKPDPGVGPKTPCTPTRSLTFATEIPSAPVRTLQLI
jgi:hypothetical protein